MSSKALDGIVKQIDAIVHEIEIQEKANGKMIEEVCDVYRESARNLLHYTTFRNFDVREMQEKLKLLGLTRLANAEGNILGSLLNTRKVINYLNSNTEKAKNYNYLSIGEGNHLLKKNTDNLFGNNENGRRVKIMVTQPKDAAYNYSMVLKMVQNGMDCARINCAHDGPEVWSAIINNVKRAAKECNAPVKVAMDLAGPKIRTGKLVSGPRVKKFKPKRTVSGKLKSFAFIELVPNTFGPLAQNTIPVTEQWLKKLIIGDIIGITDLRGKFRKLEVMETRERSVMVRCKKTLYIGTGITLHPIRSGLGIGIIGELPAVAQSISLKKGDVLMVMGQDIEGMLPVFDSDGKLIAPGKISCIPSEVVSKVKEGEPILFDDGKIEGIIERKHESFFEVLITNAKENGSSLKAEKGINFPTLDIGRSGLTEKDRLDLKFVAKHADIVNCSFINCEADVRELIEEMEKLKIKDKISVILKIETRFAFRNLIKILIAAMHSKYLGIMIARGDLALEVGWKNMAKVQEEILSFCGAAHLPVVWATQVLENLAKKGFPSRSEITDTTSSIRAECVMLNKGPYINEAISFLNEILQAMEHLHEKKEGMWPKMEWL